MRATLLALLLFGVYLLFYRGAFKNPADEWFMFSLADSISRNGALDVDQMANVGEYKGLARFGPDGHLYAKYSPAQAALAVPLLDLGRSLPEIGQAQLALLLDPALTAATGALLFLTGRRLGYPSAAALATAISFGLATGALVYAKTFTSEPLTGMGLTLALYGLVRFRAERLAWPLVCAGAALGWIVFSKPVNLIVLPGFVFTLLLLRAARLRFWLSFWVPVSLAALLLLGYNAVRFGDPLQTGYGPADGGFDAPLALTLPALLIGPARGILLYSPVLLWSAWNAPALFQRDRWLGWLLLSAGVPFALLFALWHGWHGGLAVWGPRHWLPLLPLACLPLMEGFSRWFRHPALAYRLLVGSVLGISLLIQVCAASFNYLSYIDEYTAAGGIDIRGEDRALAALAFDISASPLSNQLRFLQVRNADLLWLQSGSSGETRITPAPLASAAALVVFSLLTLTVPRLRRFARVLLPFLFVLCAGSALLFASMATQMAATADWAAAVRWVDNNASPGAVLVTTGIGQFGATSTWLKSSLDDYSLAGLPAIQGLDADSARSLALALSGRREIWTVESAGVSSAVFAAVHAATVADLDWQFGELQVYRLHPM